MEFDLFSPIATTEFLTWAAAKTSNGMKDMNGVRSLARNQIPTVLTTDTSLQSASSVPCRRPSEKRAGSEGFGGA